MRRARERAGDRTATLQRLDSILKENFGDGYAVRPFGSTCYGAADHGAKASDVDVVVLVRILPGPFIERVLMAGVSGQKDAPWR